MNTPAHDDPASPRALFEAQVDTLDPAAATALRTRRREALATMTARHRTVGWWPAGGLVTAALALALVLPRGTAIDELPPVEAATPGATAMVATPAAVEAADDGDAAGAARFAEGALAELENDAAFYEWLATLPADTDTPALPTHAPHEG